MIINIDNFFFMTARIFFISIRVCGRKHESKTYLLDGPAVAGCESGYESDTKFAAEWRGVSGTVAAFGGRGGACTAAGF